MASIETIGIDFDTSGLKKGQTELKNTSKEAQRAADAVDGMASSAKSLGIAMLGAAAGMQALQSMRDFSREMAGLQAVTKATASEMKMLSDQAILLGAATQYGAGEAASAQRALAQAGLTTNQILSTTTDVLTLAQAGQLSLAAAADLTANTLAVFSLETSKAAMVADSLVKTGDKATTSVAEMGEALKYSAPLANALGVSFNDTSAAIGMIAVGAIKGSSAGTGLAGVFRELTNVSKEGIAVLSAYGLGVKDVNIAEKGLIPVIELLASKHLTAGDAISLFKTDSAGAALALMKTQTGLREFSKDLDGSAGAAKKSAAVMSDNLDGAIKGLYSSLEGLALTLFNSDGALKTVINTVGGTINSLTGMNDKLVESGAITKSTADQYALFADVLKVSVAVAAGVAAAAVAAYVQGVYASIAATIADNAAKEEAYAVAMSSAQGELRKAEANKISALSELEKARSATVATQIQIALDRERLSSTALVIRSEIELEKVRLAAQINEQGRAMRLKELAALSLQLAATEQALIKTGGGLAAVREAETVATGQAAAATQTYNIAQAEAVALSGAGVRSVGLLGGAMSLLGGPIGIVTALLVAGYFAWEKWGGGATEAVDKAAERLAQFEKEKKFGAGDVGLFNEALADTNEKLKSLNAEKSKLNNLLGTASPLSVAVLKNELGLVENQIKLAEKKQNDFTAALNSSKTAATGLAGTMGTVAAQASNAAAAFISGTRESQKSAALAANADLYSKAIDAAKGSAAETKKVIAANDEYVKKINDQYAPAIEKKTQAEKDSAKYSKKAAQEIAAAWEKSISQYVAALDSLNQEYNKSIEASKKLIKQAQDESDQYGLTRVEIEELNIVKAEAALNELQLANAMAGSTKAREMDIEALKIQIEAMKKVSELHNQTDIRKGADDIEKQVRDASAKSAKAAENDWDKASKNIQDSLTDALMRGFESGKDFGKNMVDVFINALKTQLLAPALKGMISNLFQGGSGGSGGGFSGLFSGVTKLFSGGGSGGIDWSGIASKFGSSIMSYVGLGGGASGASLGLGLGTASVAGQGATALGGAAGGAAGGAGLGSSMSVLGPIAIAMGMKMSFDAYKEGFRDPTKKNWQDGLGNVGGSIMNAINKLGTPAFINKIFGEKWGGVLTGGPLISKMLSMVSGETRGGAEYIANDSTYSKLRGPSGGDFTGGVGGSSLTGMVKSTNAMLDLFGSKTRIASAMGGLESSTKNKGFAYSGGTLSNGLAFGETRESTAKTKYTAQEAANAYAKSMSASMVAALKVSSDLPDAIKAIVNSGGAVDDILQALAAHSQTIEMFSSLVAELPFKNLVGLSYDAKSALLDLNGGLQQFTSSVGAYYQNFYSEAERIQNASGTLSRKFSEFGVSLPQTVEGYRNLVNAQDLSTASGRKTYTMLIEMSSTFYDVSQYNLKVAEDAAQKQAKLAEDAAKAAEDAAQKQIDAMASVHNSISDALKSLMGQSEEFNQMQQQQAKITLQSALAVAKAGGSLVGFAGLDEALKNVQNIDKNKYSSYVDYAREFGQSVGLLSELEKFTNVNGSHANGLDSVPFDGYMARLHKGEQVVTARESAAGGVIGEEVKSMKEDIKAMLIPLVEEAVRSRRILSKWDGDGMPEVRAVA